MHDFLQLLHKFFRHDLWQDAGRGPVEIFGLKCLRILVVAGRGLIRNQSLVRSSSLAYATILGFIPLCALLFAISQAMGLPRLLATYLLEQLAPGSREFGTQILQYIEATKVTSLGVFGVVALLADLVIVMTNVEKAFNKTWQVSQTRPLGRKISDYLSIFLIFPILMAVALSVSSSFWGLRHIIEILSGIMPTVFFTATRWLVSLGVLWLAFVFIYLVMPNTHVRFTSAVLGGVIGGTVWQGAQEIFIRIQGAATYYNAIYGALYNLLFLFIWMFWCWLILLFGAEFAYAHQNLPRITRRYRQAPKPAEPVDEYLGLAALASIGTRFYQRQPPLSRDELTQILPGSDNLAGRVIQMLQDCNLVVEVVPQRAHFASRYLPNLPLHKITVGEVLDCLRRSRELALEQSLQGEPALAAMLHRLSRTPAADWQSQSMQELVESLARDEAAETEPPEAGGQV